MLPKLPCVGVRGLSGYAGHYWRVISFLVDKIIIGCCNPRLRLRINPDIAIFRRADVLRLALLQSEKPDL